MNTKIKNMTQTRWSEDLDDWYREGAQKSGAKEINQDDEDEE